MVELIKNIFCYKINTHSQNTAETERDRKRKLYRKIMLRGPHAFGHLVDALGELGYWDLVRDLDPDSPFAFASSRNFNPIPSKYSLKNSHFLSYFGHYHDCTVSHDNAQNNFNSFVL